ncbi:hypothetical protein [Janthinobacterium lividum]|uniref:hypothetical protein n=1 Tax=Janthinobacterium lividum TaxID=29581 RepID=UPI0008746577|nr:hypothetical protein [Janthinobacterium lividum]MCC7716663.1 hypothetical protein [Janthinobacterium lividum]OEZ64523.1 hypothetical protein JANLI_06980 [Janthinobacterium lividum]WQE32005.1 hypothetical protein U0004_29360 [Janthinobacterium lividum]STS86004.1 Uncharacterised protein [Janthinobacterium lividum]
MSDHAALARARACAPPSSSAQDQAQSSRTSPPLVGLQVLKLQIQVLDLVDQLFGLAAELRALLHEVFNLDVTCAQLPDQACQLFVTCPAAGVHRPAAQLSRHRCRGGHRAEHAPSLREAVLRMTPVDAFKQHRQLHVRQRHPAIEDLLENDAGLFLTDWHTGKNIITPLQKIDHFSTPNSDHRAAGGILFQCRLQCDDKTAADYCRPVEKAISTRVAPRYP